MYVQLLYATRVFNIVFQTLHTLQLTHTNVDNLPTKGFWTNDDNLRISRLTDVLKYVNDVLAQLRAVPAV